MSAAGQAEGLAAHILVAEDEPELRANLVRLLRLEGYRVSAAADGGQAIEALRAAPADLLLSDLSMPGVDGMALLAWVRAEPRTAAMPVVLLSARADSADMQEALAAGASGYVTKPYQRELLLQRIRALLAGARAA